jgi:hypothetical protein
VVNDDKEVGPLEFFITWALVLGLLVVPGLINYYVNRYYAPPGTSMAPTIELMAASLTLTFALLVAAVVITLGVSLGWDELKEETADFVQLGLVRYGQERPIALSGVLAAVSVAEMALLALLGVFRVPSRFVR